MSGMWLRLSSQVAMAPSTGARQIITSRGASRSRNMQTYRMFDLMHRPTRCNIHTPGACPLREMSTERGLPGRVLPILELGNPRLRVKCKDVAEDRFGTTDLEQIVADMIATMRQANGAGIAANQIGILDRIFVVHGTGANPRYPYKPKIPLTVFVNPVVEPLNEEKIDLIEGCLSVPGFRGQLQRAAVVRVRARRPDGSRFAILATGHCAGTMQHECDHLDGVLFPDLAITNAAPRFEGDVLMTSAAFEEHFKAPFFEYASSLNKVYDVPLVFEE